MRSLRSYGEGIASWHSKQGEQIVETAQEARQAERGPTLRNMLIVSTGLVILAFAIIWLGSFGR
jgi:hypothetical protein